MDLVESLSSKRAQTSQLLDRWRASLKSPNTLRAYSRDLASFGVFRGEAPTTAVEDILSLGEVPQMASLLTTKNTC